MINKKRVADDADMIINGYAFTKCEKGIRVLNLNYLNSAALLTKSAEVLETSMDDIETKIVVDILKENIQYMEE